jgi:hypothetical protein
MKKKFSLPVKPFDFAAVGLAIVLTAASAIMVYGKGKPDAQPQVFIRGLTQSWVVPLDADETLSVPGPLGNTVVRIRNHQAWVVSSPCDNQVCVAAGHIFGNGQWVACLPNQVMLMVEEAESESQDFDAGTW